MEIRQAKLADVPTIMKIYEKARYLWRTVGILHNGRLAIRGSS